nr:MFS transporter [Planosporangium thailandense]
MRERDFRLVFTGQALSLVGDGAYLTVLTWFSFSVAHSARSVGLVLGALAVATLCSLLLGGALADRYDRRRLMIVSDLGRFGAVAALTAMTVTGTASLPGLMAVALVAGLFDGLFSPAFAGLVPLLVRPHLVPSANALVGFVRAAGGIVGPLLGGVLYAAAGPATVFGLNAASFLAAALLAGRASPAPPRTLAVPENPLRGILEGARYVLTVPLLVSIPVAAVALMISEGPTQVLMPKLVSEHFHGNAGTLGAFNAAVGVGSALGALCYAWLRPGQRRAVLVYSIWTASHVVCAVLVLLPSVPAAVGLAVVRGLLGGYGAALWETLLMQVVPQDKLSRVFSFDSFGVMIFMPLGYTLASAVAPLAATGTLIATGQLAAGVLMISLLAFRRVRGVQ